MSTTGKVAVLNEPRTIEIKEVELPAVEPGAVLTEVLRTNLCGSELHFWKGNFPYEGPLGHEAVVQVAELGDGVKTDSRGESIEPGDSLAPVYFIPCQECYACQNGEFAACVNQGQNMSRPIDEHPHFHATFSTHYYIKPNQYAYKVPDNVPDDIAAGANCALSQVLYGLDKVGVSSGDDVVIQGAGGLGLHATAVARERGANVILVEGAEHRIKTAKQFGADNVIDMGEFGTVKERVAEVDRLTGGKGADVAVEVAGVPEAFSEGIRFLKNNGEYLEIGNISFGASTEFEPSRLTWQSRSVTAIAYYPPWYLGKALDFLSDHIDDYPYDVFLGAEFSFEDIEEAFTKSENRDVTRASLVPQ
ncbi:zinc-binding dehydrogenase [Haladaptatus sp. NG-SE-30]